MLALLYLPSGVFLKPREIEFDPHIRVGRLLLDCGMEELMKHRKFSCKCFVSDDIFTSREIFVTSVDPRNGLALFRFEDEMWRVREFFSQRLLKVALEKSDVLTLLEKSFEVLEKFEMGMKGNLQIEGVPAAILSRFYRSYRMMYIELLGSDMERLKEKTPSIAFNLMEYATLRPL